MPLRGGGGVTLTAEEPAEEPVEEPIEESAVAEEPAIEEPTEEETATEEPVEEESADAADVFAVQAVNDGAAAVLSEEEGSSNTCGENLTWTYESGKLTISGTGAMKDYSSKNSVPWYAARTSITAVVIEEGVTSIGRNAFCDCKALASVTIPSSVTSIALDAFQNCSKLESVYITSVDAWCNIEFANANSNPLGTGSILYCDGKSVTDVEIPAGTTKIPDYAFCNYQSLKSVTIPESVTSIGNRAFRYCRGLTEITIPDGVTSIGYNAFEGCTGLSEITIPDSVETIGEGAFSGCTALKAVKLPDSLTTISQKLFMNCTALESVEIGNNVTTIAMQAFSSCMALKHITIPDSVETIGGSAFSGCNALESLVVGSGMTKIESSAFGSLTALKSITLGSSVTSVAAGAFSGSPYLTTITVSADNQTFKSCGNCLINKNTGALVLGGVAAEIPSDGSVKTIGSKAFSGRKEVTNIVIPEGVTSIPKEAFYNCADLAAITIPSTLKSVEQDAFTKCDALEKVNITDLAAWCAVSSSTGGLLSTGAKLYLNGEEITKLEIPEGVTKIGAYVFLNCSGITSVQIPETVTTIGQSAFSGCSGLTEIVIPNSVTSIGQDVFKGCTSLASLKTPIIGNGTSIYSTNGYLGYMFGASKYGDNSKYVPMSLQSVTVTGQIIGKYAFYGCSGLTSITMADSVASIGDYAFYDCLGLESIEIGKNVTSIGSYAFYDCTKLREVILPDSVTSIGKSAFESCISLQAVRINDLASWCGIAFADSFSNPLCTIGEQKRTLYVGGVAATDITIPGTVSEIGPYAFYGYENLARVQIPESVTSIHATAFEGTGCYNDSANWSEGAFYIGNALIKAGSDITSCTVKKGTTLIANAAFSGCTALTTVTLPEGLVEIGSSAFNGCTALTEISIPAGVSYINEKAFYDCTSLATIQLPDGLSGIGQKAFYNTAYYNTDSNWVDGGALYIGSYLIEVKYKDGTFGSYNIKDGTTLIADNGFSACNSLEKVSIPASLTTIGNSVFNYTKTLAVTYAGTKAQWDAVQIGYDNGKLYSGTVTCSDGNAAMTIKNSGSCGAHVYWTLDDSKTLTIYGTGAMAGYGKDMDSPFKELTFNTVVVKDGVTTIGEHIFDDCYSFSILIPESVTMIGQGAFYDAVVSTVYYAGTEEQWNNIIINNYNNALELANIVYEFTGVSIGISISGAAIEIGKAVGGNWVVTVKLDGKTLTKGTDYTVEIVSSGGLTTATVTGCGDYSGTAAKEVQRNPGKVTGGEGEADILDVLALLKAVAGIDSTIVYGDVNDDGEMTILDVLTLLKYVAGIEGTVVY